MRFALSLLVALFTATFTAGCAGHPAPAPARTYLELPAVDDMEGVVLWLELQRTVAVKVDGLDPASAEVRTLDARILAATQAWVEEDRLVLLEGRRMLLEEQKLGPHHARMLALDQKLAALDARLAAARDRYSAEP